MADERKRQKKLERQRKKREEKRKAMASPERRLPPQGLSSSKMSDTLKDFALPMVELIPSREDRLTASRTLLVIAKAVWNATVLASEDSLVGELQELSRRISKQIGLPPPLCFNLLMALADRKLQFFANDRRLVLEVDVTEEGDSLRIYASSAELPF